MARRQAAQQWWQRRLRRYNVQRRAEHRVIPVGHGEQPQYTRKTMRMLTRLFR